MFEESAQQLLVRCNLCKCVRRFVTQFGRVVGAVVGHAVGFAVSPDLFLRIQVRGIGRELFHMQSWLARDKRFRLLRAMRVAAVPDEDDRTSNAAQQLSHEGHNLCRTNRLIRMQRDIRIHAARDRRNREGTDGRHAAIASRVGTQDRRLPHRSPCPSDERLQHQPRFVEKSDGCLQSPRFFLTRFQSLSIHSATASSSRWRACRSGFWHESPIFFNKSGRYLLWYVT